MKKTWISLLVLVVTVVFLGNCDWFGTKDSVRKIEPMPSADALAPTAITEDVLLTIGGKPVITITQFQEYVKTLLDAQPQLKQLMAFMPNAEYELFQQMKKEQGVYNWVKSQNIDQSADYQRDKKMSTDLIERQLALKYFQDLYPKQHNIQVTDAEARKAYDEQKKTIPQLTISRGGVSGKMVLFDKQADAQDFLNQVKQPGVQFDTAAKTKNLTVKNLVNVNEFSFDVDPQVKEKVSAMKKFNAYELIKTKDNKYAVVIATGKEEAKYVPFEEVRDAFKQQLLAQKLFGEELDKLMETMKVVENKGYFDKLQAKRQEELDKMQKQAQNAHPQAPMTASAAKKNDKATSMPVAPVQGT